MTLLERAAMVLRADGVIYLIHRPTGEWGAVSVRDYASMSASFLGDYEVRLDLMSAIELSAAIKRRN